MARIFLAGSLGGNSEGEDLGKVNLYNPFGLIRAYVMCLLCSFRQSWSILHAPSLCFTKVLAHLR